jgi:MFS family permease
MTEPMHRPSLQSRLGLNATNFFLAEVTGVIMPFLGKFLGDHGWNREASGMAAAVAGLGVFLMQTPAGFIVDRVQSRRALLAGASLLLGTAYFLLPVVPVRPEWIHPLLFVAGAVHAFFAPLLGALALALVGHRALSRTMGANQGSNHAGNIAAALSAMMLVGSFGTASVFYTVLVVSMLAAASVFLMRPGELDETRASGAARAGVNVRFIDILRDRGVLALFAATALFHLAKAPVMPLVGRYISELGGSDVQVAAVVLTAQVVMIPVALAAGWLSERWGRKPVFAIGFLALPIRIFLYSLTSDPWMLVALQTLDGIGAGIYGVVVVSMCADLTRGRGRFNALQGSIATAVTIGGMIGPLVAGWIAERFGFAAAFQVFAAIAAIAAVVFLVCMPETASAQLNQEPRCMPDFSPTGEAHGLA